MKEGLHLDVFPSDSWSGGWLSVLGRLGAWAQTAEADANVLCGVTSGMPFSTNQKKCSMTLFGVVT